ncbi:MAG: trigger factor [Peptococcaceae bacterium]|jgi:trigger factor|nr:trigger factor [Peptococcaceae bacterium]
MAVKMEKMDKSRVLLEIRVEAEKVSAAYSRAAKQAGKEINIPGFRKGKAPKHIIERYVGKDYLKDRAMEELIKPALLNAYQETEILPVSAPTVDVVQMEEDLDLIFKATVEVKPEVELGQYTGFELEKKTAEVTDEQVEEELKRRQDRHAKLITVEDGEVLDQDIATIDYEGFIDNVPFEGGKGEDFDLTIGSGMFIPGFEDQLKGARPGQELEVNVRFPDDYQSEDLAGKDAMFKVKVKAIKRKELVPLDDEFAKDISEFDTLAELREDIKQKMLQSAELSIENEYRSEVVQKAVDKASVEIPEGMIQGRIDSMMQEMEMRLASQGIPKEYYEQYLNENEEQIRESYRVQAVEGIKTELVLEAIAKQENITASNEDVDKEIQKLAAQYGRSAEELKTALESRGELDWFKLGIVTDKTIDFLVNSSEKKDSSDQTANKEE